MVDVDKRQEAERGKLSEPDAPPGDPPVYGRTSGDTWVILKSIPQHGHCKYRQACMCPGDIAAGLAQDLVDKKIELVDDGGPPSCKVVVRL